MSRSKNEIGIWLSFGGYTAWVIGDTFIKLAAETMAIMQIMTVVLITLALSVIFLASLHGGIRQLGSKNPKIQLLSSIMNTIAGFGSVIGVTNLSLADFYTIIFAAPLIVTMLAWLFLKEKADWKIWGAIVFGFAGIMVAVHLSNVEGHRFSMIGIIATLTAAFTYCCAQIIVRAFPGEANYALSFWPRVLGLAVCAIYFLWHGSSTPWPLVGMIYAILGGVVSTIGVIFTNLSLRYAPVAIVSPYHYTQIIGGAIAGYFIWHNQPTIAVVAGAIMVAAAGLYILKHQRNATQDFSTKQT